MLWLLFELHWVLGPCFLPLGRDCCGHSLLGLILAWFNFLNTQGVCEHVPVRTHACKHALLVWRSEENLKESILSHLLEHGLLFPLRCVLQASWPKGFLAILLPLPPSCHRSTDVSPSDCSPQLFLVCVLRVHTLHCACGSQETIRKIQFFPSQIRSSGLHSQQF